MRDALGDVRALSASGFTVHFERDLCGDEVARRTGSVRTRWTRDHSGRPLTHILDNELGTLRAGW